MWESGEHSGLLGFLHDVFVLLGEFLVVLESVLEFEVEEFLLLLLHHHGVLGTGLSDHLYVLFQGRKHFVEVPLDQDSPDHAPALAVQLEFLRSLDDQLMFLLLIVHVHVEFVQLLVLPLHLVVVGHLFLGQLGLVVLLATLHIY